MSLRALPAVPTTSSPFVTAVAWVFLVLNAAAALLALAGLATWSVEPIADPMEVPGRLFDPSHPEIAQLEPQPVRDGLREVGSGLFTMAVLWMAPFGWWRAS